MSNTIKFTPKDRIDMPDDVLEKSVGNFKKVMVLGWDKEGVMDFRTCKEMEAQECLWLIENFKLMLLDMVMMEDYEE